MVLFGKNRLVLAPGFSFTLPHLTLLTHTLHPNKILTNIHTSLTSSPTYRYTSLCNLTRRSGAKIKNGVTFSLYPQQIGDQMPKVQKGLILAQTHNKILRNVICSYLKYLLYWDMIAHDNRWMSRWAKSQEVVNEPTATPSEKPLF